MKDVSNGALNTNIVQDYLLRNLISFVKYLIQMGFDKLTVMQYLGWIFQNKSRST